MIGALHAAGAGGRLDRYVQGKRSRAEWEDSQASINQMMQMNAQLVAMNEFGAARRARAFIARLHPAKYLKMDPLLKEILFPLLTFKQAFGFTSVSCINQASNQTGHASGLTAVDARNGIEQANATDQIMWAKPRGSFRGIASFTLRSSRIAETTTITDTASKLNTKQSEVAKSNIWSGSGLDNPIYSHFRRFFNGPTLKDQHEASDPYSSGTAQQVQMTDFPGITETIPVQAKEISVSEVGHRHQLEKLAAYACPFVPSNRLLRGPSALQPPTTGSHASRAPATDEGWRLTNDNSKYYPTVLDTPFRIADGYLELDISNGKVAPALIEIVLHSFKKQFHQASSTTLVSSLYQSIWQAVQIAQRESTGTLLGLDTVEGSDANDNNMSGGWQAFYDPAYPLLKTKAKYDHHSPSIATEVHRSSHVLSPGQSKTVRINLGSLYYNLGGQTKSPATVDSNAYGLSQVVPKTGAGTILVTVGHSGFEALSAPSVSITQHGNKLQVVPDASDSPAAGSGFWVGKQHTASEIVVSGNYCEKFYPMCPGVSPGGRTFATPKPGVPFAASDSGVHFGLPAAAPATDVVATTNANDQSYPSNNTTGDRMEI